MSSTLLSDTAFTPQLNTFLFWDVNINELDYRVHADWIIRRVFDKGTMDDIYTVVAYYGKDKVSHVLTNTIALREPIMYLTALMFHLTPTDFVCYK